MKIKKDDWIEIFRTGDYGKKGIYTRADLDQIVKNFNGEDQVPIVVGHPQTDSPAWGWLGGLRRVGEILQARVADLHADFRKALQDKKFRNRSVRIASTRAGKKLLHLGFLGAALPEVEGLGSLQFNRAERYADYEFSLQKHLTREDFTMEEEIADLKEQSDSLKKQLDELKKQLAAEKQGRKEDQEALPVRRKQGVKAIFPHLLKLK
ncbi:MAG: hypothetical protein CSB24_00750 [Deltaproteobacteria bacterium]|nr:MAG: hypothetical protein CSB24_00750 [Deltaproteobacteria bacterium]